MAILKEGSAPAGWVLFFSFTFSILTLFIYLTETNFSDEELFLLLAILRYSSFTVCVCSLFFCVTGIVRLFINPSLNNGLLVLFSILGALYGAGIVLLDAFITTITGGQS